MSYFSLIWLILILLCITAVVMGDLKLYQNRLSWVKSKGKSVFISCRVTDLSFGNYVHWYQKKDGQPFITVLYIDSRGLPTADTSHPERSDFSAEKDKDFFSLRIDSVRSIHSATYFCAVWQGHNSTGNAWYETKASICSTSKTRKAQK